MAKIYLPILSSGANFLSTIKFVFTAFLFLAALGGQEASAQCATYIVTYTSSVPGNAQCVSTNTSVPTPMLTVVNGATNPATCSSGYTASNFPNTGTYATTLPAVRLTITPNAGYALSVTQFEYTLRRSVTNGPTSIRIAYSTDGGTTWIAKASNDTPTNTNVACTTAGTVFTWNVTDFTTANTLLVQLFGFGAASTTSELIVRNFRVVGTVVCGTPGCIDPLACNFNSAAGCSDLTCTYGGCTVVGACNYNATAGCDDGSCTYPGCLTLGACNYNPAAACLGPCVYTGATCDDGNATTINDVYNAACVCVGTSVASPLTGLIVKEKVIPLATQLIIDANLTDPLAVAKCWQVFACIGNPLWEMQSIFYGGSAGTDPAWRLNSSTSFFQAPFGNQVYADNINPAFFGFFPELAYDSWWTINTQQQSPMNFLFVESGPSCANITTPPLPVTQWNNTGGDMLVDGVTSCFGSGLVYYHGTAETLGFPDVNNEILIGQFTTDGSMDGAVNLQLRQMNADGTPYDPPGPQNVVYTQDFNLYFYAPGWGDLCQLLFFPIELLSFVAVPDGIRVAIKWVTTSELNNELFIVERSANGIDDWMEVSRLPGAGTSESTIYYTSYDHDPIHGLNFYRLKQIDYDGQYKYSEIEVVEFMSKDDILIYPNPSHGDVVNVGGNTDAVVSLTMFSIHGKVVMSKPRGDGDFRQIDLQHLNLPAGMYTLEFALASGEKIFKKLTVQ
ncbi:MAG: T9SS type A sorting domain-containing protein [Flavobacteriales bacterium]|nr:T9SS type A sorting domain-containing protein [Flavobacteriales bacterium]